MARIRTDPISIADRVAIWLRYFGHKSLVGTTEVTEATSGSPVPRLLNGAMEIPCWRSHGPTRSVKRAVEPPALLRPTRFRCRRRGPRIPPTASRARRARLPEHGDRTGGRRLRHR